MALVGAVSCLTSALPSVAGAATSNDILTARPLLPQQHALLEPAFYPETPPEDPPQGSDLTEQQASTKLDAYLGDEFPNDSAARASAKAVFNSAAAKQKISSPALRAAVASLKGTIADGAIDYILHAKINGQPKVADIHWAPQAAFSFPHAIAEVRVQGNGQTFVQVNDQYRGENPFLFAPTMLHEPLHQDFSVANYEEAVNQSFESLIWLHELIRHPGLATSGKALSRINNSKAVIRLNSGVGARMGFYKSNAGRQILPGSTEHGDSWSDFFTNGTTTTTPGNALLGKYLANIHTPGAPTCSSAQFSDALLHCIDKQGNAGLTSSELVKAAKAMKLNTNIERDRTLSISYRSSNFKGTLSSQEKPCTRSQSVAVYRQKSGPDAKVGSDTTDSSGAYSVHKASAKGRFYAKAPRSTVAGTGVCLEAKSSSKLVG